MFKTDHPQIRPV